MRTCVYMVFVTSSACGDTFQLCEEISDWTQNLYIFVENLVFWLGNCTFCLEKNLVANFPCEKYYACSMQHGSEACPHQNG